MARISFSNIRKSDAFYFAALHASGDERARFTERGRFFHDYSTSALLEFPTRALARPVVVLLTSGFMRGLFDVEPNASEPPASANRTFGQPEPFVPQRVRAKKRAVAVAAAGGLLMLLLLVLLMLR